MNKSTKSTSSIDHFNNVLAGNKSTSSDCGYSLYAPNGRELRRAVERAGKKSKKKGGGSIPDGFYAWTLDQL